MRAWAAISAVGVLVAASGCGDGERSDPFTKVEQNERARDAAVRSQTAPRWERVTALRGSAKASSHQLRISKGAVQWRVRWRCERGRFRVRVSPSPSEGNPLVRKRCRGAGEVSAIDTGKLELDVKSGSRWRAVVEQQVTDPIDEPPLPEMRKEATKVLARGRFYPIGRRGRGTAILYRLANDRLALRLEGFNTSPNTDLFVWASEAARPKTTRQALRAPHREVALLRATVGNQNYVLPRGANPRSIRSIVIWCEPVRIAYTAASLR